VRRGHIIPAQRLQKRFMMKDLVQVKRVEVII